MNWYRRHIGDYLRDTAHLSLLEHGAYSRLLDVYYANEGPLPSDRRAIHRLVSARSKEDRDAVDQVLDEYFVLRDDGLHQTRCDEEIAATVEIAVEADARKENERERQRRHRQRRKELFDALRERGTVPPFDTSTSDLETLLSRAQRRNGHVAVTRDTSHPVTRDATAIASSHKPITKTQKPEKQEGDAGASPSRERATPPPAGPPSPTPSAPDPGQNPDPDPATPTPAAGAAPQSGPAPTTRKSRLAIDELPEGWAEYCRRTRPELDPAATFDAFRDWHRAQGSTMSDWPAAWRTWVRKERPPPAARHGARPTVGGRYDSTIAGLTRRRLPPLSGTAAVVDDDRGSTPALPGMRRP